MVIISYNSNNITIIFISLTFHESSEKYKKEASFSPNLAYRISSNKHQVSNNHRPLISASPLGIHIEKSASL